jgi:hypothetical protein
VANRYSAAAIGGFDYVSLELDAGGNPHMVYYRNNSLMAFIYILMEPHGLKCQSLPCSRLAAVRTLELTDGGVPVVAFYYPAQSSLSVATRVGDAFVLSPVETAAVSTDAFSLHFDGAGSNDHPPLPIVLGQAWGNAMNSTPQCMTARFGLLKLWTRRRADMAQVTTLRLSWMKMEMSTSAIPSRIPT